MSVVLRLFNIRCVFEVAVPAVPWALGKTLAVRSVLRKTVELISKLGVEKGWLMLRPGGHSPLCSYRHFIEYPFEVVRRLFYTGQHA